MRHLEKRIKKKETKKWIRLKCETGWKQRESLMMDSHYKKAIHSNELIHSLAGWWNLLCASLINIIAAAASVWIETRQTDGDANETSRASNYIPTLADIVIYRNQHAMDSNLKKKESNNKSGGQREKRGRNWMNIHIGIAHVIRLRAQQLPK